LSSSLACRGGEGEKGRRAVLSGAGGVLGDSSSWVLSRGINRSPTGVCSVPSWWWAGVDLGRASPVLFKRLCRQIKGAAVGVFLLAGRGGRGKRDSTSVPLRFASHLVVRASGRSCCCASLPPSPDGNGFRLSVGSSMEERRWIHSALLATAAGGGVKLEGQEVNAVTCGFFYNDYFCKCKPIDLLSSYGHYGYDTDLRQGQFTCLANGHITSVLNASMIGFITTKFTPACIGYYLRRSRSQCLLKTKGMVLNYLKTSCYTQNSYQAADHFAFAFFVPLGCIRRRQLRESLLSLPRFSGEDFFDLSSVFRPQDLQLNLKPHRCLPSRLLVEPLALRLARYQEAPREDNCRFFSVRSLIGPLAGSNCVIPHRQCAVSVLSLASVCLVGFFISDSQSLSCKSYAVTVSYF
jgi:hypothetical protein